ncbi:MAG: hypothetical protein ACRBN8_06365 [Nannocystales bacterium]
MRSQPSPLRFVPLVALLALAACNEHPLKVVELSRTAETVLDVNIAPLRNVDILFVIDNSGSMAAEQANLAANLAPMIEELEAEEVAADYRIAVTTTDVADGACSASGPEDGNFVSSSCRARLEDFVTVPNFVPAEDARDSACLDLCPESLADLRTLPTSIELGGEEVSRPWIENVLGTKNLPEGVSTEAAFACMGPQGINGCGFEGPLRAMQRALTRTGANSETEYGFLRDDAILLVVFVTDEADCSAQGTMPDELRQGLSVGCWDAGVQCTPNEDGSLDCASANLDVEGNAVPGDEAVLTPVEDYVALLEDIRTRKREASGIPDLEVMVSVVAGVPTGYPEIPVRYSAESPFSEDFGVDAGCESAFGEAVPPVRLLELAEAFAPDTGTNVSSVCAQSYRPALKSATEALIASFEPACVDTCLAGGVNNDCVFSQRVPGAGKQPISTCEIAEDGSARIPAGEDACVHVAIDAERDDDCIEARAGAEFKPLFRAGVPRVPGSAISATCSISENEPVECPWTQQ